MDTSHTPEQAIMAEDERILQQQQAIYRSINSSNPDLRHDAEDVERRLTIVAIARALFHDLRADKLRGSARVSLAALENA